MDDHFKKSLELHRKHRGKWGVVSKVPVRTLDDLSVAYTPGVASVSTAIDEQPSRAYELTMKGNSVAIVSDGSAVLGLGNIGPLAAIPVMEGKAILFKEFADIDGVPLVISSHSVEAIVTTVKAIAPTFGGINLEDISAPVCFEVEEALQDIGIPVFHDDQHGTAIVLAAALENACKVVGKELSSLSVVINGAGAAGIAISKFLCCDADAAHLKVKSIYVCDSKGIISSERADLNCYKKRLLTWTNAENKSGTLRDALQGADVFIGVSRGNILSAADIECMAANAIIFAMANPIPEIMPDVAKAAGAAVVGTGRSDFPNQVNNVLAFPGVFRGALDAKAKRISEAMKVAAAHALAGFVKQPTPEKILPDPLNKDVAGAVAEAVKQAALANGQS